MKDEKKDGNNNMRLEKSIKTFKKFKNENSDEEMDVEENEEQNNFPFKRQNARIIHFGNEPSSEESENEDWKNHLEGGISDLDEEIENKKKEVNNPSNQMNSFPIFFPNGCDKTLQIKNQVNQNNFSSPISIGICNNTAFQRTDSPINSVGVESMTDITESIINGVSKMSVENKKNPICVGGQNVD